MAFRNLCVYKRYLVYEKMVLNGVIKAYLIKKLNRILNKDSTGLKTKKY